MNFFRHNCRSHECEDGYVLLVLLLMVALLSVGFIGMIQKIDFEIKRDREEEMIHRGVQYSRAVRKFVNKFQRYPSSIEELESTNNIRFLRKRYKDPITGKDFKILHYSDMPSFISTMAAAQAASIASQQKVTGLASSDVATNTSGSGTDATQVLSSGPNGQTDPSDQSSDTQPDVSQTNQNGSNVPSTSPPPQPPPPQLAPNAGLQPGGGLIIGVASTSKEKTIREFNKKDHYNQWQFIYDPSADPSGFLNSPSQPRLTVVVQRNQQQNEGTATPAGADSGQTNMSNGSAPSPQELRDFRVVLPVK